MIQIFALYKKQSQLKIEIGAGENICKEGI